MFDAPLKIAALMRGFAPEWGVAGGWAIDLFLGRETRAHDDIEIAVFRRDQRALRTHLADWTFKKAAGDRLADWSESEVLRLPIHEIHCFNSRAEPRFLEVLLNEADDRNWIYRRAVRIVKSLSDVYLTAKSGVRFLRPEIVLLYKSKNPREKDERDFRAAVPLLDSENRTWLKNSLALTNAGHHWLEILSEL